MATAVIVIRFLLVTFVDKFNSRGAMISKAGDTNVTGAEPFVGPGVELVKWAAPKGWALLRSWWLGKELLIIGQARAGKTTLLEYLEYGLFDDAKPTEETTDIDETNRFDLGTL